MKNFGRVAVAVTTAVGASQHYNLPGTTQSQQSQQSQCSNSQSSILSTNHSGGIVLSRGNHLPLDTKTVHGVFKNDKEREAGKLLYGKDNEDISSLKPSLVDNFLSVLGNFILKEDTKGDAEVNVDGNEANKDIASNMNENADDADVSDGNQSAKTSLGESTETESKVSPKPEHDRENSSKDKTKQDQNKFEDLPRTTADNNDIPKIDLWVFHLVQGICVFVAFSCGIYNFRYRTMSYR